MTMSGNETWNRNVLDADGRSTETRQRSHCPPLVFFLRLNADRLNSGRCADVKIARIAYNGSVDWHDLTT